MESLLTYILQVNLLLALVYFGYQFLLKSLTFYNLNRLYFLLGSVYAFLFPFLNFKEWFSSPIAIPTGEVMAYLPFDFQETVDSSLKLSDVFLGLLGLGVAIFAGKLLLQLFSLFRIHFYSNPAQWRNYLFRNVIFPITPFSFFNKVYLHRQQHEEPELHDIFKHEYIHVKGQHSVDVLLFELVLIGCWYNPFVWLMRRAVRQNLEFLTDQQVLDKGVDRQTYQYSLLNVSKQGARVGISNQFNFNTLKKRIMMMNKKRSSQLELSKYAFMLPILIFAGITFSVNQAEGKIERAVKQMQETRIDDVIGQVNHLSDRLIQPSDTIKDTLMVNGKVRIIMNSDSSVKKRGDLIFKTGSIESGHGIMRVKSDSVLFSQDASKRPALFINGKEVPANFDLKSISGSQIEHIEVLKYSTGEDANKYPNGRVLISMKKGNPSDSGSPRITLRGKLDTSNTVTLTGNGRVNFTAVKRDSVLKGEVSGLSVNNTAASTFSSNLKIRGNSWTSGNEPIFIVDGKEVVDIDKIDPNTIESMAVLKGQNATAIYGEKAKNGVIVITSKEFSSSNSTVVKGYKSTSKNDPIQINRRIIQSNGYESFLKDIPASGVYYLNGKETKAAKLSKLDPAKIKEIAVFPDSSATNMFGEKAQRGAVSIMTK